MSEAEDEVKVRGGSRARCPYCHAECTADDDNVVCNECLARHHRSCWDEAGGRCSACRATVTARSGGAPAPAKDEPAGARPPGKGPERGPLAELSPAARERLEPELGADEDLLWVGHPATALWGHVASHWPILWFAVPWTAFSLLAVVMFIKTALSVPLEPTICLPICVLPMFVLFGVAMLGLPVWSWRAENATVLAVTSLRVLVCEPGGWGSKVTRSYAPEALTSMERVEGPDGKGDLVFEVDRTRKGQVLRRHGLMAIPRVREVEALIRSTLLRGEAR